MKLLPIAATLSCAALFLPGCGRPGAATSDADQQAEERIEAQEAYQLSQLHEREAALDERERLLAQREQQATPVSAPPPGQPAETEQPLKLEPPHGVEQPVAPQPPTALGPAATPSAQSQDASYQSFYDALSAYGAWVQLPLYAGYLWQPSATVQNPRWRPYTLGHWVYTDDGWTWVSDEPFGWITYHYGRWMRTRTLGWVWMPGDQWAPAWVSWRYGDDYVGWAPLPPEAQFDANTGIQQWADNQYSLGPSDYTFVPAAAFGDDNMADDEAPSDQEDAIYDDSNNITNIYYDTGAYAIICYGPNYEFMRSKSRRPLSPPFTLRRTGFRLGGNNAPTAFGKTLQVAAPRVTREATPTAPHSVRGIVVDSRLIIPPGAPPAPYGRILPPSQAPQPLANARVRSQTNPGAVPQPGAGYAARPVPPGEASGTRVPPEVNPAPPASNLEAQRSHDLEVIQEQQAARERQAAEAARLAAEEQSAAEAARAGHAEAARAGHAEAAAKTAHEQAPARPAAPSRPASPATVPTGTQATGRVQQ